MFKEGDTVAVIEKMEYRQETEIDYVVPPEHEDTASFTARKKNYENSSAKPEPLKNKKLHVHHLIDVRNFRFLYTSKVMELFSHLLVGGLKFSKLRPDIELQRKHKRNFRKEYQQMQL
jgi:hypothetical protein